MKTYVIEYANGTLSKIESMLDSNILLSKLRREYSRDYNTMMTFTPHVNRVPVAIYELAQKIEDENSSMQ